MVGAAVKAGPGPEALEGAGGWVGTAATFVACVSPELLRPFIIIAIWAQALWWPRIAEMPL